MLMKAPDHIQSTIVAGFSTSFVDDAARVGLYVKESPPPRSK